MSDSKGRATILPEPDPFILFDAWYKENLDSGILPPNSVSLGTASTDGRVSVRTVLLKGYSEKGFVFFTNYNSRKGSHLSSNPMAALLFYWPELSRQIRIEGMVSKVSEKESVSYFKSRPRESQLSAWASEQSTIIADREYLEKRYEAYKNMFYNMSVEKPRHWGGYLLKPDWFEFWQEGNFRLHHRLSYSKRNNVWVRELLAP
jgi:pyridoxamine 5'-phosphate oxidase